MTYDNELRCRVCGAIGMNELEVEEEVRGDEVIGLIRCVICECGECVKILDDEVAL